LEHPRGGIRELPFGRERRIELAVRMTRHEVVEQVERDSDVVRRRAEVRIEFRDIAALGDDELTLLGRLCADGAGERRRQCGSGAGDAGSLQKLATGETGHEAPPEKVLLFAGTWRRLSRPRRGGSGGYRAAFGCVVVAPEAGMLERGRVRGGST